MAGDRSLLEAAGGEAEFTDEQLREAERLMEEVPRIEAALKNFLSLKMAEGLTLAAGAGEAAAGAQAASSSAPVPGRPSTAPGARDLARRGCARVLLKALNGLVLPPTPEWGTLHPQADSEGGLDFMARLGAYKITHALWSRCLGAGQKPAKLLGRSALRHAYPEALTQLLKDAPATAAAAGTSEEDLRSFLEAFGRSLDDGGSEGPAAPPDDADIVWAVDMRAALAARQEARKAEAAERVRRAATAESFAGEMRAALGGGSSEEDEDDSTVRIEELAS